MLGNHNAMPYVLLFQGVDTKDGLFHYFGLEPYDERKHGLSLSLFIDFVLNGPDTGRQLERADRLREAWRGRSH